MKNSYWILLLLALTFSCQTEEGAGPANESTFMRYFGTQDNNVAVLAIEVADGFALLSNTEIEGTAEGDNRQIKLIKTDQYGHQVWEKNYPETNRSWTAASFLELTADNAVNPGYLIIGESINTDGTSDILLLKTDMEGNIEDFTTISGPSNASLHGRAVTLDTQGNYIVLASMEGHPTDDMYVSKISAADLSAIWSRTYGAGKSNTIKRIYYDDANQNLWWAGSVLDAFSDKLAVRLVRAPEDAESSIIGAPIGKPEFDENAVDFCSMIGGWVFTGSTNENGSDDIFVMKVNNSSNIVFSVTLEGEAGQNETGVSIARAEGNMLVVLGTMGTSLKKEDLTLIKLDPTGAKIWQRNYGGADRQEAASVRVTSDGSYLVFGTTYFINEAKLMLLKVDRDGTL